MTGNITNTAPTGVNIESSIENLNLSVGGSISSPSVFWGGAYVYSLNVAGSVSFGAQQNYGVGTGSGSYSNPDMIIGGVITQTGSPNIRFKNANADIYIQVTVWIFQHLVYRGMAPRIKRRI